MLQTTPIILCTILSHMKYHKIEFLDALIFLVVWRIFIWQLMWVITVGHVLFGWAFLPFRQSTIKPIFFTRRHGVCSTLGQSRIWHGRICTRCSRFQLWTISWGDLIPCWCWFRKSIWKCIRSKCSKWPSLKRLKLSKWSDVKGACEYNFSHSGTSSLLIMFESSSSASNSSSASIKSLLCTWESICSSSTDCKDAEPWIVGSMGPTIVDVPRPGCSNCERRSIWL